MSDTQVYLPKDLLKGPIAFVETPTNSKSTRADLSHSLILNRAVASYYSEVLGASTDAGRSPGSSSSVLEAEILMAEATNRNSQISNAVIDTSIISTAAMEGFAEVMQKEIEKELEEEMHLPSTATLKEIEAALEADINKLKGQVNSLKGDKEKLQAAENKLKSLESKLATDKKALSKDQAAEKNAQTAYDNAVKKYGKNSPEAKKAKTALDNAQAKVTQDEKNIADDKSSITEEKSAISSLNSQISTLNSEIASTEKSLQSLSKRLGTGSSVKEIQALINQAINDANSGNTGALDGISSQIGTDINNIITMLGQIVAKAMQQELELMTIGQLQKLCGQKGTATSQAIAEFIKLVKHNAANLLLQNGSHDLDREASHHILQVDVHKEDERHIKRYQQHEIRS